MTPSDVKIVAENINDFIEVPDGINRLRKAVLTLAMSGQLLAQDEQEGTAQDLYNEILKTKDGLLASSRRKKTREILPISQEEVPFEVPQSWKWVRLVEIGEVVGGGTPSTTKSTYFVDPDTPNSIPWLTPADMRQQSGVFIKSGKKNITEEAYKKSSTTLMPKGSVIFSSRAPIGYVGIAENPLTTNQGFKSLVPHSGINSKFLYWFLTLRADDINLRATGTTFKEISGSAFANEVFVLVPPKEQERIVEKIEVVMKQLDELESQKNERDLIRVRLTRSAMQALGSADSKVAFEQLTELIKTPQDIKELENAILTLAVSGKLVSQDKSEGTAEDLYTEIQLELNNKVKGKKSKVLDVAEGETPFEIPESWRWVRLIEIGKLDTGKTPRTGVNGNYGGEIPFIGPGDIQNRTINSYSKLVTTQGASESKYLHPGDVLMVCIGGTIGKSAYVDGTYTFNQQINKITPFHTDGRYLSFVFQTEYFQKLVWSKASGGATPLVNLTRWSSCIVPLPPLAEQKRIVKKVEELMEMVSTLKAVI
ncbi:MAG: restriction endonuclease subunit S [Candidatus Nomurabacteria bacterium]|nr:restriction endonuclease subunit S [Candidatus Nomurabacteria bacterium]USN87279.1 MAG: restriction endonuclease subunit S [Candidatus Nomurabacteria bacterium]